MQMNSEELKRELSLAFPSEIKGYKRPDEPISSGHDFFLELPQIIAKDPVLFSSMNLILSVLLSNDNLLKQWVNELEDALQAQDFKIVTEQVKGLMSPEMLKKLNGIATGANNYVHPSSHPATMITQDATHRFVTDTEKNTWNSKASTALVSTTANGLAPRRDGNNDHYLAGDGTWKAVNHANKSDNATNATNADTATKVINGTQYYLQSGNGDIDENNVISQNKANVVLGSWYSTGFRDLCSTGNPIRVAINHRNGNIKTTGNVIANGAMYSATPGTSDNSTRVATTAFVRNLINQFKTDGTLGGIVGGSLTQNGWAKFSNGLILQWGFRSDTGYGGRTVTFPIAFTKQCFNGHVTTKRGGDSSNGNNYVDNLTTTNMWTVCDGGGGYWIAIGY